MKLPTEHFLIWLLILEFLQLMTFKKSGIFWIGLLPWTLEPLSGWLVSLIMNQLVSWAHLLHDYNKTVQCWWRWSWSLVYGRPGRPASGFSCCNSCRLGRTLCHRRCTGRWCTALCARNSHLQVWPTFFQFTIIVKFATKSSDPWIISCPITMPIRHSLIV